MGLETFSVMLKEFNKNHLLFRICVVAAIVLVVIGWVSIVPQSLMKDFSHMREQWNQTSSQVADEFIKTQEPHQPNISASISEFAEIAEFVEKKETVSHQLIESLKTRIETEAYASPKTAEKNTTK